MIVMIRGIALVFCLSIALLTAQSGHTTEQGDVVVVNTVLFSNDDVHQNRMSIRRLKAMIRADGAVFIWVAIRPQAIGFNVLQETLSVEQRRHQMAVLRRALDAVLSDLHTTRRIQRAPAYFQRGVSELVKVTDYKALRELLEHQYVQQITLDPGFSAKL